MFLNLFTYLLHYYGSPYEYCHTVWYEKRMVWLSDGEKSLMICLAISIEYRRVTDKQTNGHLCIASRSKNLSNFNKRLIWLCSFEICTNGHSRWVENGKIRQTIHNLSVFYCKYSSISYHFLLLRRISCDPHGSLKLLDITPFNRLHINPLQR